MCVQEGTGTMDFTCQDIAVIEDALHLAIRMQENTTKADSFREVLFKLQSKAAAAMDPGASKYTAKIDGIRFDYDDAADLL